MIKTYRKLKRNRKYLIVSLVAFLVACVIMSVFCFQYYEQVRKTVKNESRDYILEISKQISDSVSSNINDNYVTLKTIEFSIHESSDKTFSHLAEIANELKTYWNFDKLLLIDGNAIAYNAISSNENGDPVKLYNDQYLQDVMVGRKNAMSASEQIDGIESVIFAIPVQFTISNKNIVALAVTFELDSFDVMLSMKAFDNRADIHVIRQDGTIVIRSSTENIFKPGYNILNSIENLNNKKDELLSVRKNIRDRVDGFAQFELYSEQIYMAYVPLDENIDNGNWCLLTFVPVTVVNVKSTVLLRFTMALCGVILAGFVALLSGIFYLSVRSRRKLEKIAYYDEITNGNTIKLFNEIAGKYLQNAKDAEYTLVYTNLEKFKLLNEQYGREKCNRLLKNINNCISADLSDKECLGRLFADNFCVLIKNNGNDNLIERLKLWKNTFNQITKNNNESSISFIMEIGAYVIDDVTLPLELIIDRAKLALKQPNHKVFENVKISIYNEDMRKKLIREKYLEDKMEYALANEEFQVYLQPKYCAVNDKIDGAEALVRWINNVDGIIFPNDFIPLFEKNGFIKKLDMYVFEVVCKLIRKWIDEGKAPVKISVNCSRAHLNDSKFIDTYIEIAEKYNTPKELLEIEFTENIVFEDVKYFSDIINAIHNAGFGCSLDDFGSGYSSLSMIQDIPVDTIKLDKVFFFGRTDDSSERTESVVASIINMSKALRLITVAEGVEEEKQVSMLKRLGCDLIQGYYYARPMPIENFEKLAFEQNNTKDGDKL